MTNLVVDIAGEAFSTSSQLTGKQLTVHFKGCLDMETQPALELFLGRLRSALQVGTVREATFHTSELYLINSSSISQLAAWVKVLKTIRPVCRVTFKTNPNLPWQRRTFDAIRGVAQQLVSVE